MESQFYGLVRVASAPARASSLISLDGLLKTDELLSYECARGVSSLAYGERIGPVFSEESLVFTSLRAAGGKSLLLVNAGGGIHAILLEGASVNRIRFELPARFGSAPVAFFLSYMHGENSRSRVFDFSVRRPPVGRDELDYHAVRPVRAEYMLPNLEYAIFSTAENIRSAFRDGRLKRHPSTTATTTTTAISKVSNCDHLARKSPMLARNLQRNLEEIQALRSPVRTRSVVGTTTPSRRPASFPAGRR
ncbi:MAG: hypothetical protein HC902_08775 [Calothrix sp. SM1_5_4]|nr:hypothetical protein [Calothrix sp. SM1_5_4]